MKLDARDATAARGLTRWVSAANENVAGSAPHPRIVEKSAYPAAARTSLMQPGMTIADEQRDAKRVEHLERQARTRKRNTERSMKERRRDHDLLARFCALALWLRNDADKALAELGINAPEFIALRLVVLSRCGSEPRFVVGPMSIAEHFGCTSGYATKIVAKLAKLGPVDVVENRVRKYASGKEIVMGKRIEPTRAGLFRYVRGCDALDWRATFFQVPKKDRRALYRSLSSLRFHIGETARIRERDRSFRAPRDGDDD